MPWYCPPGFGRPEGWYPDDEAPPDFPPFPISQLMPTRDYIPCPQYQPPYNPSLQMGQLPFVPAGAAVPVINPSYHPGPRVMNPAPPYYPVPTNVQASHFPRYGGNQASETTVFSFSPSSQPPIVDRVRTWIRHSYGVIRIKNIPYNITTAEVHQFIEKHVIAPELLKCHTEGYPIHIIMERSTGKTMDTFIEVRSHEGARDAVERCFRYMRGYRLGQRQVILELSDQAQLLRELFPRARCISWDEIDGTPQVIENLDPHSSGFRGFLTKEELNGSIRHSEFPQRSPFAHRSMQRTYECTMSTLYKFPWDCDTLYTLSDRDGLYVAYIRQMAILADRANPVRDLRREVGLDNKLLLDFTFAGMNCPAFSERQRFRIVQVAGAAGHGVAISRHAMRWPFQCLSPITTSMTSDQDIGMWLYIIELGLNALIRDYGGPEFVGIAPHLGLQVVDDMPIVRATDTGLHITRDEFSKLEMTFLASVLQRGWGLYLGLNGLDDEPPSVVDQQRVRTGPTFDQQQQEVNFGGMLNHTYASQGAGPSVRPWPRMVNRPLVVSSQQFAPNPQPANSNTTLVDQDGLNGPGPAIDTSTSDLETAMGRLWTKMGANPSSSQYQDNSYAWNHAPPVAAYDDRSATDNRISTGRHGNLNDAAKNIDVKGKGVDRTTSTGYPPWLHDQGPLPSAPVFPRRGSRAIPICNPDSSPARVHFEEDASGDCESHAVDASTTGRALSLSDDLLPFEYSRYRPRQLPFPSIQDDEPNDTVEDDVSDNIPLRPDPTWSFAQGPTRLTHTPPTLTPDSSEMPFDNSSPRPTLRRVTAMTIAPSGLPSRSIVSTRVARRSPGTSVRPSFSRESSFGSVLEMAGGQNTSDTDNHSPMEQSTNNAQATSTPFFNPGPVGTSNRSPSASTTGSVLHRAPRFSPDAATIEEEDDGHFRDFERNLVPDFQGLESDPSHGDEDEIATR